MAQKLEITPEEALLKEAEALERLVAIYGEIASRGGATKAAAPSPSDKHDWAKLPLTEAIIEFLRIARGPQTPKQIWAALEKAGCEVESDNPANSVKWAIKKINKRGDELEKVGWGQWVLRSRYPKGKLEKMKERRAGRGGRSSKEHSEATKRGIEKRRSEGKLVGAPRKITDEHIREFKRLVAEGETRKSACGKVGMSYSYYNTNRPQIEDWKEGDPWPLPPPSENTAEEPFRPRVRLVQ